VGQVHEQVANDRAMVGPIEQGVLPLQTAFFNARSMLLSGTAPGTRWNSVNGSQSLSK
jgi:hypothetical protein